MRGDVTFHTSVIGDPVLLRSDGSPAYNFAVVVDDALMEVTHVVRGEDHISNTPRQILFYEALGFTPPAFAHLSLVMGPDHTPLSKRHGATSVAEFRAKGYLPEALVNYLALIGWSPGGDDELLPVDELARRFSHRGRRAQRRRVRRGEARLGEPPLPADRRPGAARAPRRCRTSAASGLARDPSRGRARRTSPRVVPMASGSVDRLDEIPVSAALPVRVRPGGGARRSRTCAEVLSHDGAREVIACLARELSRTPRLATARRSAPSPAR